MCVTIHMKAVEQFFHVVLFVFPYRTIKFFFFSILRFDTHGSERVKRQKIVNDQLGYLSSRETF